MQVDSRRTEHASGTDRDSGVGEKMHRLIAELYPLCRSITGEAVRQTMAILGRRLPLEVHEVPSGTPVLDWEVPPEWVIRDAWVSDESGRRVVDFRSSNLHVLNYSIPFEGRLSLEELKEHVYTIPDQPDVIPYRTSYYSEQWGFCMAHEQLLALPEGHYDVCVDSDRIQGHLTYGELFLPGLEPDEVLFTCHTCHPSLANDNLSGIAVATFLASALAERPHRYSYRFLFIPGMIGSLTWLSRNEERTQKIKHGLVLSCLGDRHHFTYKRSRRSDADIDRLVCHLLAHRGGDHEVNDFSPYGYDERQFCSPGFNLPVGLLTRSTHGKFPEYHTSADNLEFVDPAALADSLDFCLAVVDGLEKDGVYVNQNPKGEPQLGRRGLYRDTGGSAAQPQFELALLWVLNQSDGQHSLLDIAERSGLPFAVIADAADALLKVDLLKNGR